MFHVAFYVLMEIDAKTSYDAEYALEDLLPATQDLQSIGKIRSKQWTVTELMENDPLNRPAEQPISTEIDR